MTIPKEINLILEKLEKSGHEAYVVGGCVRDLLLEAKTKGLGYYYQRQAGTNQKIISKNFYENKFGTVTML